MLKSWLAALVCAAVAPFGAIADSWDDQANAIIANFTVDQLVGQMTQVAAFGLVNKEDNTLDEDAVRKLAKLYVGSYLSGPYQNSHIGDKYGYTVDEWRHFVTRIQEITMEENGGHPMIFGIDSVHGAVFTTNATLFGHQINGAATFNPDLVYEMGRISSRDTQASGIPWTFGPILEIAQNPLWPRTHETFGEDTHLVSVMADALIRGMQSNNQSTACMKHFVGYSKTPTGHDKDAVTMSDFELLNYFLPPFIAAMDAGVMTAMENYISINGVPTIGNTKILKTLLRDDLGFDGLTVSDFAEVQALFKFHRVAESIEDAVEMSLKRTTLDMSMASSDYGFINVTKALAESDPKYLERVKDSARRVVKTKLKLGLYDNPIPGAENAGLIGSAEDVAAALEMARESIVLLQNNDSTLPLAKSASVFLTGPSADNIGFQCSGWTLSQKGYSGNEMFPNGISVRQGLENVVGADAFTYFNGLNITGNYSADDLATAKQYASQAEYTIAVVGEQNYVEKTGDIDDLALPAGQVEYVSELAATGTKVILVLFEGRPRLLGELPEKVYAVIDGMLPCEQGGQALAEIIYGDVNPSGRLPITYPKHSGNVMIKYNHPVSQKCADSNYCETQWDFGTGLSYTNFTYSDLTLSTTNVTSSAESINVSVVVTNSGAVAGKETVMLFLTQPFRSIFVPEVKMLKKFSKVSLDAGASTTVAFTLTKDDWSVYYPQIGSGFKKVAEDTTYVIAIKPETDCDVYNTTAAANDLCASFTLATGEYPFGTLDELN